MKISNKIGNSHVEAVEKILYFVNSFDVHKLLFAIDEKRFDEDTILNLTLDIQEQNLKLSRQKKYLFDFTKNFNKVYTHPDNKVVEHSASLMRRMSSGVSGIKKQVKKFCKTSRRRLPEGASSQAIDKSLLASEIYMKDLFGLDSYPDCVKELFSEMVKFYSNMTECLVEAQRSLEEEKATKNNNRKCLELLKEAMEKCGQYQEIFIDMMNSSPEMKALIMKDKSLMPGADNPVLNDWKKNETSEEGRGTVASRYFHNCTLKDVSKIKLYKTITEANGDSDIMNCMTLFNCDADKARRINHAISLFDSLLPEICKRNKIPAISLFVFLKWCSESIGYHSFLNYFNKRYKEAGGTHDTIEKAALSGASRQCANSTKNFVKGRNEMLNKLQEMFPETKDKQTA